MSELDQKLIALSSRKVANGHAPISAITAYDYPTARIVDEEGVDIILVGDSLGMVVLGYPDTTQVTMEHMLHHTAAVARGVKNALIIGDLPINSYDTSQAALKNAKKLISAGANAVKLEGGINQIKKVTTIIAEGIPVIGHLGMLPQRVLEEGGYKKKGKTDDEIEHLLEGATALEKAGVCAIVLESVIPSVSEKLTNTLNIPTIGIGCGDGSTDGEIAVISDVIGSYPWFIPPFATIRANVANDTRNAVSAYIQSIQK